MPTSLALYYGYSLLRDCGSPSFDRSMVDLSHRAVSAGKDPSEVDVSHWATVTQALTREIPRRGSIATDREPAQLATLLGPATRLT